MSSDRNDAGMVPGTMTPEVSVISGEMANDDTHFWVRGRPLSGLLPGRVPRKRIALPVLREEAKVLETLRFLLGLEVLLASYPIILLFQSGLQLSGLLLALLPLVILESLRQLVRRRRSVPTVHAAEGDAVVIRGAHPRFSAGISTSEPQQNARRRGSV